MSIPDLRKTLGHAAVAAGGTAAALMHFSIVCDDEAEIRAAADECLAPILQSALLIIDAAGVLPDEEQRAALRDIIGDYLEPPGEPEEPADHEPVSSAPMPKICS